MATEHDIDRVWELIEKLGFAMLSTQRFLLRAKPSAVKR